MIAKSCPEHSLKHKDTLVAISGSGNVAQFTALKVIELGATVISLSDSRGSLICEHAHGFSKDLVLQIGELKLKGGRLDSLKLENGYSYHPGNQCAYNSR
jgi:glutamate dehydrogenase (NADP+)